MPVEIEEEPVVVQHENTQVIKYKLLGYENFPFTSRLCFKPLLKDWQQKVDHEDVGENLLAKEILQRVKKVPEFWEPIDDLSLLEKHSELVDLLMTGVFPISLRHSSMAMASRPFDLNGFYFTPTLKRMVSYEEVTFSTTNSLEFKQALSISRACAMILNKFYDQDVSIESPFIFTIQSADCGTQGHFKSLLNTDYVEIVPVKPLKELTQEQINLMLSNVYDTQMWLEFIPPENFEFRGVVMGNLIDVTEEESISRLKYKLLEKDAVMTAENMVQLEQHVRNFYDIDDLRLGITAIDYPEEAMVAHRYRIRRDFLANTHENLLAKEFRGSIYERVCRTKEVLIVENLTKVQEPTQLEVDLVNQKLRSIIIAPLTGKKGKLIGLLELGSPIANELNSLALLKIKEILPLFSIAVERSREEVENKIQAFVREKYTAIHPSIEWKFTESAFEQLEKLEDDGSQVPPAPIMFDDIYPLYGQADIVGSSNIRNKAIQADFVKNLELIDEVMQLAAKKLDYPLLRQYDYQIKQQIQQLEKGISSNDETLTMDFIKEEVHPLLDHFRSMDYEVERAVKNYFKKLDDTLGIIYDKRRAYEDSVRIINDTISKLLDQQEVKAQAMLPHYFEKYKTDGVQYELYVGEQLLKEPERFSSIHLRNLRLWQLMIMCDITREMEQLKDHLPVTLSTAQLIFVYSSPLSIRFRTDEKRFDVDGAYNIRYEIIKKRIDKALIEGTKKRLTVAGKIAIVYTSERDREEYMKYIDYLIAQNYITDEVEDLTLNRLQGVHGLKALRVTVV